MLTQENNELLCRVSAGTPMGEVFRSIWLPAVPSSQLPKPGGAPVRIKLLGEELVAFRDGSNEVGIVQANCAHRLAPLFYGKVEQNGIRCAYHGWLYNRQGQCTEIPSEGEGSQVCKNMRIKSYRTVEKGGVVWVFMGDHEPPQLPRFPWIDVPENQRISAVWLQETNWMQGVEGEIDSSHVSILHSTHEMTKVGTLLHRQWTFKDPKPKLYAHDTDIGFMSVARRRAEQQYYWRITQWMAPMFSFVPSAVWPIGGRAWVPIDDENTYTWDFSYLKDSPIPDDYHEWVVDGRGFPPKIEYQSYRLNTGTIIDTWIPKHRANNNYLIDRESQQLDRETTGIYGVNDQDRAMQEGMGRLPDRSREKLVAGDLTVVTARRKLLGLVKNDGGIEQFRKMVASGAVYAHEPVDEVADQEDLLDFLKSQGLS